MRKKWLILVLLLIFCVAFSLMYEKQNLFKRAVVVGIGIDEKEGEYLISIEYLKEQKYVVHTTKASTLDLGIENISKEIGLKVSISQCVAIIVQKTQSVSTILYNIAKDSKISTNAVIVATNSAKSLFNEQLESADCISTLILDTMQKNKDKKVLKDILICYEKNKPIELISLNVQDKSLYFEESYKLELN